MELTTENYYSLEADKEYMSCSQYQDFLKCEARALAKLEGRFPKEETEALLVGNYFHTALESPEAHEKWVSDHVDCIFKKKVDRKTGEISYLEKYAPYVKADEMLDTAINDPLIEKLIDMSGESEKIMTGEIFGVPWKIRLDKYIKDKRLIIDWKTAATLTELRFNPSIGEKETFIESNGYMMRAAVYTEVEKQFTKNDDDASFVIVAISKESPPDKGAYLLNHRERYDWELDQIKKRILNIIRIKKHEMLPRLCGKCDYCRSVKVLEKIVPYYTLNPNFAEPLKDEAPLWRKNANGTNDTKDMEVAPSERVD